MRYPILALISIGNQPNNLELCQPAPWFFGKNWKVSDQIEHTQFEIYSTCLGKCFEKCLIEIIEIPKFVAKNGFLWRKL